MEFQHTDKVKDLLERVTKFMDDHVYEGEKVYADQMTEFRNQGNPWQVPPVLDELKAKAKACLLYTSPSPRDRSLSRMPSSA